MRGLFSVLCVTAVGAGCAADSQPLVPLAAPGPLCSYTGRPPAAVSNRRTRVRVLTQNAFGLDRDGDANCRARGQALGRHIANASPPFDVVALQEHWEIFDAGISDCDPSHLTDAIWSTGRYRASNNYYRHRPRGEPLQLEVDGALSIFTLHPIEAFDENEWDHIPRDGPVKTLHGSTFSRIRLNDSGVRVDVYNVHLLAQGADGCDRACRRGELEELRDQIRSHSGGSGNPVLVMGDFNIGGPPSCAGNERYQDIMQVLEGPRDLWLEAHPADDGFTVDCLLNSTLSGVEPGCAYRERIDFMFAVESPRLTNSRYHLVLAAPGDIRVARIRRSNGGPVSDHFGIEATLELRERGQPNTPLRGLAGKCMDVAGGQSADGTPVQLFDCNGTAAQRWTLGHDGQLRGLAGKCLTVRFGSTANRTPVELRACTGSASQRFDLTAAGELRSRLNASKCVEVQGGFTANRTPVQLFDCNGTASQLWQDQDFVPCLAAGSVCGSGQNCCNGCGGCAFNCGGTNPIRLCD